MRHGAIVFVELPVRDLRRAADFYGSLFGWVFEEDPTNPRRWLFTPGGAGAMGALTTERPVAPGIRIAVSVTDLASLLERIVGLGGGLVGSVPASTVGDARELIDPDGNHLFVLQGAPTRTTRLGG